MKRWILAGLLVLALSPQAGTVEGAEQELQSPALPVEPDTHSTDPRGLQSP